MRGLRYRLHMRWMMTLLLCTVAGLTSCSKQQKPMESAAPKTFDSPDHAGNAVADAAKSGDREAMLAIFGRDAADVIYSGDTAQDKTAFAGFASDYAAMHRWRKVPDSSELLITGTDNKVFPIPLRKSDAGRWYFNVSAGKQEILARRIGRDESAAIDICSAIAAAQREYFAQQHDGAKQYAQKFISDEGKQNGLYWAAADGQPKSPLGPLVAYATAEGYQVQANQHHPYYGYYFVMLDQQGPEAQGGAKHYVVNGKMVGGFGILAYPAEYQDSGVMTFVVNQSGVIYQKNLGKDTGKIAAAMTEYNPDRTWSAVEQ